MIVVTSVLTVLRRVIAVALLAGTLVASPAWADVSLTFWSRDSSSYFPHAFVTLKGTVDATGEVVDTSYGFTLDSVSPVALFKSVGSHIDITNKSYMLTSDAQFRVRISDAQYAAIKSQVADWGAPDVRWNLNKRNCVHFVAEIARRAGLTVIEDKRLMKKPKSFTLSLIPLNPGRVSVVGLTGQEYFVKFPAEEINGVPITDRDSVLERRMNRRTEAPE